MTYLCHRRVALSCTDGTDLYAFRGGSNSDFFKYSVARDTWTAFPEAPGIVDWGGALTVLDGIVYGLRGDATTGFWRYPLPTYTP